MEKPSDPATPRRIEEGRAHFNAHRYFEAHEVWEEAWLVEQEPTRRMLQGLIQIAAGFLKAGRGQARPSVRLLDAGLEKLADAARRDPVLAAFVGSVRVSLDEARRWERGEIAGVTELPDLPAFGGFGPPAG